MEIDKTTATTIGAALLLTGALTAPLILPDSEAQEEPKATKYVATMYYEGRTEPTMRGALRVTESRALTIAEIDHATVIVDSSTDVVLTLPADGKREVRGFHVLNVGTGRVTLRAPDLGTVAGRDMITLASKEALQGAPSARDATAEVKPALPALER